MDTKIIKEKRKLEQYLQHQGRQISVRRRAVFAEVMNFHGHFSAEELVKRCHQKQRTVSRATIYRSISELLAAGIIRETAYGHKHHHYEHLYDERRHHHAVCVRCRQHLEFPDLDEEKKYYPYLEKEGFKVMGHEMHFYGLCQKCQEEGK